MNKDDIYAPCEVPLSDTDSDQAFDTKPMFVKSQSERLKELGHRLSGKVYDVRGKFELAHSKHSKANDRKNSLINPEESQDETNEAFKSDTSESDNEVNTKYREVKQTDSEEDYKYLEVLDDGSEFDDYDSRKDNSKKDLRIRIEWFIRWCRASCRDGLAYLLGLVSSVINCFYWDWCQCQGLFDS